MSDFNWLPRPNKVRRGRRQALEYCAQFIALEAAGEGVTIKEFCAMPEVHIAPGYFGRYLLIFCAHNGNIKDTIAFLRECRAVYGMHII